MGSSRPCVHVDGQTVEYSRLQGHALYLVEPARHSVYYELLKPTETITGDRYRTQLMRLSRFKPMRLKDKRIPPQYMIKWFCSMTMLDPMLVKCESGQDILENVVMGSPTSRRILQTLLLLTITCFDQWHTAWSVFPVLWRSKKLDRFVDSFKRWPVFSTRDSYATRKMKSREKVVASDGQYFES